MSDANKDARASQEAEMKKLGLTPAASSDEDESGSDSDEDESDEEAGDESDEDSEDDKDDAKDSDEEDEDEGDADDDADDDSEDEDSEEDDSDEDDEDDEDDGDSSKNRKKKHIPFKKYNQMRKDLKTALKAIAKLTKDDKKADEKKPDDFDARVDALSKEIGITDPENFKKLTTFLKEYSTASTGELAKKLEALETAVAASKAQPVDSEFREEWQSFTEDHLTKDYPNITKAEKKQVRTLMRTLAHSKKTGGVPFIDTDGTEKLSPYALDYIFFKNRDKFEAIITTKKVKGMERSKTPTGKKGKDEKTDAAVLPPNATLAQIKEYEKESRKSQANMDNLRVIEDNSI